jgi:long-chain acyl-CoA synthetase
MRMENKPWLQNYDKGVPFTLEPYPDQTLIDVVRDTVQKRPDQPALLFKGKTLTYRDLDRISDALANALIAMGIKKGDRVAIIMANTPQFVIAEFGIWKAGAIAACINPVYTPFELQHALNECGAETAIVMTMFYDKVKEIQANTKVHRIIATNVKDYLPSVKRLLFTLVKEEKEGHRATLRDGEGGSPGRRHHPVHRRHHWPVQGCRGLPPGPGDLRHADLRLVPEHPARV